MMKNTPSKFRRRCWRDLGLHEVVHPKMTQIKLGIMHDLFQTEEHGYLYDSDAQAVTSNNRQA